MARSMEDVRRFAAAKTVKPFPFAVMEEKPDALDRLDIRFTWGGYGFRVLRFHLTTFPPGKVVPFHKHSDYEMHFIPRGKGRVILEKTSYSLTEGMFYLTGPNVLHYQEAAPDEAMDELCLHVDIVKLDSEEGKDNQWGFGWEHKEADDCVRQLNELPIRPAMDRHQAMQWFLTAYRAWHENQPGYYTTIKQSVIQILLRSVSVFADKTASLALPPRDMKTYRFQLAVQFIEDNYGSPFTLEDVAERLHISGRQLQRLFRQHHKLSFSEYVENVRLSHVCSDLLHTNKTIERIAAEHGFMSSNYLYSVFKKRFRMTPGQFKERQRDTAVE